MKLLKITITSVILLFTGFILNAQIADTDSITQLRKDNVKQLTNANPASLFTNLQGKKYEFSFISSTETPFYLNSQTLTGTLTFNNILFENLPLIYDINKDEIIFRSDAGLIELRKELVENFSLFEPGNGRDIFINTSFTAGKKESHGGYFKLIYKSDKSEVLVKTIKDLDAKYRYGTVDYSYIASEKYYLHNSGRYYHFKSLDNMMTIMNVSGDELKYFVKSRKFSRHRLIEDQVIETMAYIDALIQLPVK